MTVVGRFMAQVWLSGVAGNDDVLDGGSDDFADCYFANGCVRFWDVMTMIFTVEV